METDGGEEQLGAHLNDPWKGNGMVDRDGWSWCCKKRGRQNVEIIRCEKQQALVTNTS